MSGTVASREGGDEEAAEWMRSEMQGQSPGYPCGSGIAGAAGTSRCIRPMARRRIRVAEFACTSFRETRGFYGRLMHRGDWNWKSGALLSEASLCVHNNSCSTAGRPTPLQYMFIFLQESPFCV